MDDKIKAFLTNLYNSNKLIFYVVVPVCGLILLAYEFRTILINILVKNSKDILTSEEKTDAGLAQQAQQTKQEADQAVQQGDQEASKEPPVGDDWDQK